MTHERTNTIVVGVDGGAGGAGALRYGVKEARRHDAELRLVHVCPSYPPMSPMMPSLTYEILGAGKEILEQARSQVSELAPDLPVKTVRVTGPRIAELVTNADDARLLVIGKETRTALERVLGAGTTAAVATHAHVPVVVVPQNWQPPSPDAPIVVGLKSPAHSEELLGTAFRAAAATGAPLVVVHTWKLPDEYADRVQERTHADYWLALGAEMSETALAPWRREYPDVRVTVGVVHDEPARALVNAAKDARLVVLVRPHARRLFGDHLGGTARAVIRAAACPVEVVPAVEAVTDAPGLKLEKSGAMLR